MFFILILFSKILAADFTSLLKEVKDGSFDKIFEMNEGELNDLEKDLSVVKEIVYHSVLFNNEPVFDLFFSRIDFFCPMHVDWLENIFALAIKKENRNVFNFLSSFEINPNAIDFEQVPVLFTAIEKADIDIVQNLCNRGANVNIFNKKNQVFPLEFAVSTGKTEIVILLLKYGADISSCKNFGETPEAIINFTGLMKEYFITPYERKKKNHFINSSMDEFARYNILDPKYYNAFEIKKNEEEFCYNKKVKFDDDDIVSKEEFFQRVYLNNLNQEEIQEDYTQDFEQNTIRETQKIAEMAKKGDFINITEIPESQVDFRINDGSINKTFLYLAVEHENDCALQLLLSFQPNLEIKCGQSAETALILAAKKNNLEFVKNLLNAGSSVNAEDECGTTALFWAAAKGNLQMVEILVEKKANVNKTIRKEIFEWAKTPLAIAAKNGFGEIVQFLFYVGAATNLCPEIGNNEEEILIFTKENTLGKK